MLKTLRHLRAWTVLLCFCVALATGCSSSSDDEIVAAPQEFSGQVLVPGAGAAPALAQVVSGLTPVAGATLELIRIDEFGNAVGPVLATATSDADGNYTIELPEGVGFSADLIVRVNGGVADGLRAQVVAADVDIAPSSEYLVRKLTSGGNSLTEVTAAEVVALRDVVDEFDAGDATDIETAISNLDDAAGETIDPLVDAANDAQGDAASVAGDFHFVQFSFELDTTPSIAHIVEQGCVTFVEGTDGAGTLVSLDLTETEGRLTATPNGNGASYALSFTSDSEPEVVQVPFQLSASGMLTLFQPAEEELEQTFGWREPATAHLFCAASSALDNGVFVGPLMFRELQYGLTQDGLALDTTNLLNEHVGYSLALIGRKEAVSGDLLDGAVYGWIDVGELLENNGDRELFTDLGTLTFTQNTATTGSVVVADRIVSLFRNVLPDSLAADVAWGATGPGGVDDPVSTDDGTQNETYALDPADGSINLTELDPTEKSAGFVGNGGQLIVLANTQDGTTFTENSLQVAVKLGTANPSVDGSYKVLALQKAYFSNGGSAINRLHDTTLTITGTSVSIDIPDRVYSKANDLATSFAFVSEDATETGTLTFEGTNGRANLLIQGTKVQGFFSADGSIGVFQFADSDFGGEEQEGTVGLVILIKQ